MRALRCSAAPSIWATWIAQSLAEGLPSTPGRRSVEGRHDVLDLRVLLEGVDRHVLAVAALLVAAVRHLVDERDVRVDPDCSELQSPSHPQSASDVARPYRRGEAVVDAVRPLERLLLVAELLHRDDRAEHLFHHDLVLRSVRHDDGRRVPRAGLFDSRATGEHFRSGLPGTIDEAGYANRLLLRDERAHLGVVGERVSDLERADGRNEIAQQLVVNLRPGDDARGGRAVLAGVEEAADLDPLHDLLEVGVVEDDHRGFASQLEVDALER